MMGKAGMKHLKKGLKPIKLSLNRVLMRSFAGDVIPLQYEPVID